MNKNIFGYHSISNAQRVSVWMIMFFASGAWGLVYEHWKFWIAEHLYLQISLPLLLGNKHSGSFVVPIKLIMKYFRLQKKGCKHHLALCVEWSETFAFSWRFFLLYKMFLIERLVFQPNIVYSAGDWTLDNDNDKIKTINTIQTMPNIIYSVGDWTIGANMLQSLWHTAGKFGEKNIFTENISFW